MLKLTERQSKHESTNLPIHQYKVQIIQAVQESDFLVVTGETGSGKTTQLPQFLYHAGEPFFKLHKLILQ